MNELTETPHLIRLPSRLWMILGAWFAFAVTLGASPLMRDPPVASAILAGGVSLPVITAILIWRLVPAAGEWVARLDLHALVLLHGMRTVGLGFIFLSLQGHMHPGFAWPAGLGDAMAALGALAIGINLAQGRPVSRSAIRRWNYFGMLDFVVALGAGFLLRSALFGDATLNTDLMGSLPLVLFPLFAVPLMFITHLAIATKLHPMVGDKAEASAMA